MKKATLYTIGEKRVVMNGTFVEVSEMQGCTSSAILPTDDGSFIFDTSVIRHQYTPYRIYKNVDSVCVMDEFVAISDDMYDILKHVVNKKLNDELGDFIKLYTTMCVERDVLARNIANFNSLPWYNRLWKAFKGNL